MAIKLHYDNGTTQTFAEDEVVVIVAATSETPRTGYDRLPREYPPEYIKTANIRASAISKDTRIMKDGFYVTVTKVERID